MRRNNKTLPYGTVGYPRRKGDGEQLTDENLPQNQIRSQTV